MKRSPSPQPWSSAAPPAAHARRLATRCAAFHAVATVLALAGCGTQAADAPDGLDGGHATQGTDASVDAPEEGRAEGSVSRDAAADASVEPVDSGEEPDASASTGEAGPEASNEGGGSPVDAAPAEAGVPVGTGGFQVMPWAIYDPDGNEFLPRGADVAGPGMWWSEMVLNETHPILDCWKFNLIRLLVSYDGALGSHNTIDQVVSYFTARKIVVVIATVDNPTANWSESQFSSPSGAYQTWFLQTAQKYKNNPYVWYSIVGENGTCDDCSYDQWVPSNQQLLKVLRDGAGATNVFLSLGSTWGQEAGCTSGFVPTAKSCFLSWGDQLRTFNGKDYSGQGILYELHPYEQWNSSDGEARLANYVDRNQAMGNYVLFNDYAGSNGGGANCQNTLQYVLDQAETRRLALGGMWSFPGDPTGTPLDCMCSPGCSSGATINDCSNPTNLTWTGQQLWTNSHVDETKRLSNIRSPSPVHSATGVSTRTTLSWNSVTSATSYDVYFGTSNTPGQAQSVGNQTGTTFEPGTLLGSTDYYWRVNPRNASGTTVGGVMHFRTGS
jgi:hypothetical protein